MRKQDELTFPFTKSLPITLSRSPYTSVNSLHSDSVTGPALRLFVGGTVGGEIFLTGISIFTEMTPW